jgi:bacterioferritin (cytochrome b1)
MSLSNINIKDCCSKEDEAYSYMLKKLLEQTEEKINELTKYISSEAQS